MPGEVPRLHLEELAPLVRRVPPVACSVPAWEIEEPLNCPRIAPVVAASVIVVVLAIAAESVIVAELETAEESVIAVASVTVVV